MNVYLYHNSSDINVVDKSLSSALSVSGTLKENCSVTDPTILINAGNISTVNYMHIPEFDRYYYITNIVSVRNGLWAVSGHVDVLMSYKSQIRARSAILSRTANQNYANLYLDDDRLSVTCRRDFQLIPFPNRTLSTGGNSFVLTCAGGE